MQTTLFIYNIIIIIIINIYVTLQMGGKSAAPRRLFTCEKCGKSFSRNSNMKRHKRVCGRVRQLKLDTQQKGSGDVLKAYKCHKGLCGYRCNSRRDLYCHQISQHGRGGELQHTPWKQDSAPWMDDQGGIIDSSLKAIYDTNAPHILRSQPDGKVKKEYNFPSDNLSGGTTELMSCLKSIFDQQKHSFVFNISLGVILRNVENSEYRYYIPYKNANIFQENIRISSIHDLSRVRRQLERIDIDNYAQQQRENTKWSVHLITNILFYVYETSFPLGQGNVPDHIKKSHVIISLDCDKSGRKYTDNLCIFRCLAHHKNNSRIAQCVKSDYKIWVKYMLQHNSKVIPAVSKLYSGIELHDIPHFERCFKIQITVCELHEDQTVIVHHQPTTKFTDKMYVNMHQNHLSYITKFASYAKKFRCQQCNRFFKKIFNMRRHLRICYNRTKQEFPGGVYQSKPSIFEELEKLGIHVPSNQRCFPWFSVYDFEAILK